MLKHSPIVFRDIRNSKRNPTLNFSTVKDIVSSAKDIQKSRSTKQIDLTSFIENKNQKIKNIDEKLQVHQTQIVKNTQIIEELNQNFVNLKEHLDRQKELTANEQRKNKLLREQIQRTNKILRTKNSRIQQCAKKIVQMEKQNQTLKLASAKNQQYTKTIANLRSKLGITEQNLSELKQTLNEKERDIQKQKDKISNFETLRGKEDDLNSQILLKDLQIGNLKQSLNQLHQQKNKEINQKNNSQKKVQRLIQQIMSLKQIQSNLNNKLAVAQKKFSQAKQKCDQLQLKWKQNQYKLKDKEQDESNIKKQVRQLKQQLNQSAAQLDQKTKQLSKKDAKIQKLAQKIKQLQNNYGDVYKEKEKLKALQDKITLLKKKADSLQSVYYSIVPQIQCPFGHQLHNPVTIIPCGHNYCLGCKKGYLKQCMQCNGKLKIQAVYRNELMDDIIGMVGGIKNVMEILK